MKIVSFRDIDRASWDEVAVSSPDAWLMHNSAWVAIEERLFVSANLSFGLLQDEKVVGIQPLYLNDGSGTALGERLLHSGLHRHTGLALSPGLSAGGVHGARRAAMKEIFALADLYDVDRVQLNAHNLTPANRSIQRAEIPFWVEAFGFHLGLAFGPMGMTPFPGISTLNADQLLDLRSSEEALFANLDDRASIRQAAKAGLRFEVGPGAQALDDYLLIAEASSRRTGEPVAQRDYYRNVLDAFATDGRAHILFACDGPSKVAAIILLTDKGAASYLAGVSLPESLNLRPNDFLHWNAILWAKRLGLETYRFGPWFPEVPRSWPISKVSHFKTKFGARSVPIIQGSWFRRPERYAENFVALKDQLMEVGLRPPISFLSTETAGEYIAHHLRTFGFPSATGAESEGRPLVLFRPMASDVTFARDALGRSATIVAVLPSVDFAKAFGARIQARVTSSARAMQANMAGLKPWKRLRTLHSYMVFDLTAGAPLVSDGDGLAVWLHQKVDTSASIVFVGTDLASDLARYRQGDPAAAKNRPNVVMWGIPGERPNYLFQTQLAGENLRERPADWWCEALADALERQCGERRQPMLPNGAAGAIIVTGDDDQATLTRYAQQREALGSLPITYYLHPLTKLDRRTLEELGRDRRLELGLHPDALEHPDRYAELFSEQAKWFEELTGEKTRTLRNHGFLNDGYWGHAKAWNAHHVRGSSNLPGLDGAVINGSLLPAKLVLDDKLTGHWSILTAIGDGIVFVHGWDDDQSANCILDLADQIRKSGVPGVIVVNLHPENIDKTRGMHRAVLKVVEDGFVPWTMSECFDWFERGSDKPQPDLGPRSVPSNVDSFWQKITSHAPWRSV